MFPIKLLDDLVAILPEQVQFSSIRLPDWQKSFLGEVIAVGDGAIELEVGDRVIFGAAVGMDSVFDGKLIRIMRDTDVEAVVE